MDLKNFIRDIPDFPSPGILFRDITPLLRDSLAFKYVIDSMFQQFRADRLDAIVAVESRGFLFGAPLAYQMGKPLIPVRKQGKLPFKTHKVEYLLEYGSSKMEVHIDAVHPGERVLILDDLLATGGTLAAAARLVEMSGGKVDKIGTIIELTGLKGRDLLKDYDIFSLVKY